MDTDIEARTFDCPECCFADFGERDASGSTTFVDRLLWDLNLDEPGFGSEDHRP